VLAQIAQEAYSCHLLEMLCNYLGRLEFEARKDAVFLFNALMRRQMGSRTPTVEYISAHSETLLGLLRGYEKADLALNFGLMLRECVKHESLAQFVLEREEFYLLFEYVDVPNFDVASDAFATLKVHFTLCC